MGWRIKELANSDFLINQEVHRKLCPIPIKPGMKMFKAMAINIKGKISWRVETIKI